MFRFIRPPLAVVGNETVAEDTLADGEKKAVAVAEDELELDAAFVLVFLFVFFLQLACPPTVQRHFHRMQHLVRSGAACQMQLLLQSCSNQTVLP